MLTMLAPVEPGLALSFGTTKCQRVPLPVKVLQSAELPWKAAAVEPFWLIFSRARLVVTGVLLAGLRGAADATGSQVSACPPNITSATTEAPPPNTLSEIRDVMRGLRPLGRVRSRHLLPAPARQPYVSVRRSASVRRAQIRASPVVQRRVRCVK